MKLLKSNKFFSFLLALAMIISNFIIVPVSAEGNENYTISAKVEDLMKTYNADFSKIESEIDANIEKYRKSDAAIKVVDKNGNPVKNASVKVNQTSHDFNFGINAVNLGQYDTAEKNAKYEQLIKDTFNIVTTTTCFDIYSDGYNDYNFDYGEFRRPSPNFVNKFAKANNLRFKGQPLLADTWNPTWTGGNTGSTNQETLRSYYKNWFQAVRNNFGSDFDILDIVNESCMWGLGFRPSPNFTFAKNGNTQSNVEWAFQEAQAIFDDTDTKLEINDTYDYIDSYKTRLKTLISKDLIDSIGMQYHLFSWGKETSTTDLKNHLILNSAKSRYYLTNTYNNLKEVSSYGVPLNISEITIPSKLDGYTEEEGHAVQAEVVKRLYKMWFSIPNMNGIIYWNLVDGEQYGNEGDVLGCLVDSNFNPKPAYYVIQNYINNEWRTNESIVTDENGVAFFRGFHGDYEVTVNTENGSACGTFSVLKNGENTITLAIDDNLSLNNAKFVDSDSEYTLTADNAVVQVKQYDALSNLLSTDFVSSENSFKTNVNTAYIVADTDKFNLEKVNAWTTPEPKASNNSTYMTLDQVSDPFFWQSGHYSNNTGKYEKYTNRICLRKLIPVSSEKTYKFSTDDVVENNTIQFIIREFNSSGTFLKSSAVIASGDEYTPSADTEYIAVSVNIKGDVGANVFSLKKAVSNNTLNPKAVVVEDSPEPDVPVKIPEVSTDYNLLHNTGSWVKGHYLGANWGNDSGILDDGTKDKNNAAYRIALNKKVDVIPGVTYRFDVGCDLDTVKFVIRGYDSSGKITTFTPATSIKEDIKIPDNVVKLGVAIYDTRTSNGPTYDALLKKINDGSLNPSITNPLEIHSTMLYGASIRLKKDGNGIRFYTNLDKDKINELRSQEGVTVEMGTLIAPKDKLGSNDLTHDLGEINKDYIDVKYISSKYYSENDFSGMVGSIIDIKEPKNVARDFVGRGYIKVTKNGNSYTTYANYYDNKIDNNVRSLQFIAKAVKGDTNYYELLSEENKKLINNWIG